VETDIAEISKRVNELAGIKESDTGLAPPALWDLAADKQSMQSEQPLQVHNFSIIRMLFVKFPVVIPPGRSLDFNKSKRLFEPSPR
jgi:hypothetical protein